MGDDEIIGLADAVNKSVSEKLTWLPLGVLNFCRLKIPKRKLSCAERTTFRSPDSDYYMYYEERGILLAELVFSMSIFRPYV